MAFINKNSLVLIEGKLTNVGRQLLAYGNLTFNKFAVGDSEIDYQFLDKYSLSPYYQNILRPVDSQPNMRYPVLLNSTSTEYLAAIPNVTANERLIKNKAKERGFFTRGITSNPGAVPVVYTPYRLNPALTNATATIGSFVDFTTFVVSSATGIGVGSMLLIHWLPNATSTPELTAEDNVEGLVPRAWLWYKVLSVDGTTIVVDRNIPKFTGTLTGNVYGYPLLNAQVTNYESGVTSPYWDTETLAFQNPSSSNTSDVPVWNFSIIYGDSVDGSLSLQRAGSYPSATYEGLRNYLGINNPAQAIGVLHYTNHSNNNYYGEGFFNDTLVLELPTVMYHNSVTAVMGMTLTTESVKRILVSPTSTSTNFSLTYYNLLGPDQKVIGKVFNDLKIVSIEDAELLAALSYASNRNWTLPAFSQFSISAASNQMSNQTGTVNTSEATFTRRSASTTQAASSSIYVTYALGNGTSNNGYRNSMICQDYAIGTGSGISGIQFSFRSTDFKFLNSADNGLGFNATQLTMLFQIVASGAALEHDRWVPLDFNGQIGITGADTAITADMLSVKSWSISDSEIKAAQAAAQTNAAYYKIDYLDTIVAPALTFGSEQLFFGNVKTDIKAVAFATTFRFKLDVGSYDKSTNPTWNPTLPVQITEVGIYDNNNNLVVSGKLNYPLRKDSDEIVLISLDMDF